MQKCVQDELNLLQKIIVKTVPVDKIYLFGAFADGKYHDDEDINLCVLIPDYVNMREIDVIRQIRQAIRDQKTMPVELVVSKKNVFNMRKLLPGIEQQISQEGKVLYG